MDEIKSGHGLPAAIEEDAGPPPCALIASMSSLVRLGLRALIEADGRLLLRGEVITAVGILELLAQRPADLLSFDVRLADGDFLVIAHVIKAASARACRTIVLASPPLLDGQPLLSAGALGYLSLDSSAATLAQAAHAALTGTIVVDPNALVPMLPSTPPVGHVQPLPSRARARRIAFQAS